MGNGRVIPNQSRLGFKVHRTVKLRMEAEEKGKKKYKPMASFDVEPTWVD